MKLEDWIKVDKIKVKFENAEPDALVKRAHRICRDECYDEVWAVCDKDNFDVTATGRLASKLEVGLALSVPSFEVWLVLHLARICPPCAVADDVEGSLKKLLPTWDKTNLNFDDFREGVFDAVEHAKNHGMPPEASPSTAVWQLIESLRKPRDE